ncbi:MAG: hypothetical protein Q9184_007763 [Pyrenodesmia sp. 2 TL-2023]
MDTLRVVSIEEALQELDRRMEAAGIAYFCALLGVASAEKLWEEVDRRIFREEHPFRDWTSREVARDAYLCDVLGIASCEDVWEEVDRRISTAEEVVEDEAVQDEADEDEASSHDGSKDFSSTTSAKDRGTIENVE